VRRDLTKRGLESLLVFVAAELAGGFDEAAKSRF
jgi:hypothetical protein